MATRLRDSAWEGGCRRKATVLVGGGRALSDAWICPRPLTLGLSRGWKAMTSLCPTHGQAGMWSTGQGPHTPQVHLSPLAWRIERCQSLLKRSKYGVGRQSFSVTAVRIGSLTPFLGHGCSVRFPYSMHSTRLPCMLGLIRLYGSPLWVSCRH